MEVSIIYKFILTTVIGGILGYFLKIRTWKTETRNALFRARYNEGTLFLDAISELIGERFFLLQRYFWAIKDGQNEKIQELENEYLVVVKKWNAKFWLNRNKIRLLVNENQANNFLNYKDDLLPENPESLHYKFVAANRAVQAFKAGLEKQEVVQDQIDELNWKCSNFLENLTSDFLKKAIDLQLLKPPREREIIDRN